MIQKTEVNPKFSKDNMKWVKNYPENHKYLSKGTDLLELAAVVAIYHRKNPKDENYDVSKFKSGSSITRTLKFDKEFFDYINITKEKLSDNDYNRLINMGLDIIRDYIGDEPPDDLELIESLKDDKFFPTN